jgi:prophage DNA circulation protein
MAVATIRDLAQSEAFPGGSPWRARLLPAHFDGRLFHVESGSRESGRRIVTHEFPKKDLPYSEDMGKKAIEFSVRGYIIQFPYDTNVPLYQRDYTIARNDLQLRLDTGGPGTLQLPMMRPLTVVCSRYRMTEEEKLGGYVTFDMTFVELGAPPFKTVVNASADLAQQAEQFKAMIVATLTPKPAGNQAAVRSPGAISGGRPIPLG